MIFPDPLDNFRHSLTRQVEAVRSVLVYSFATRTRSGRGDLR